MSSRARPGARRCRRASRWRAPGRRAGRSRSRGSPATPVLVLVAAVAGAGGVDPGRLLPEPPEPERKLLYAGACVPASSVTFGTRKSTSASRLILPACCASWAPAAFEVTSVLTPGHTLRACRELRAQQVPVVPVVGARGRDRRLVAGVGDEAVGEPVRRGQVAPLGEAVRVVDAGPHRGHGGHLGPRHQRRDCGGEAGGSVPSTSGFTYLLKLCDAGSVLVGTGDRVGDRHPVLQAGARVEVGEVPGMAFVGAAPLLAGMCAAGLLAGRRHQEVARQARGRGHLQREDRYRDRDRRDRAVEVVTSTVPSYGAGRRAGGTKTSTQAVSSSLPGMSYGKAERSSW